MFIIIKDLLIAKIYIRENGNNIKVYENSKLK